MAKKAGKGKRFGCLMVIRKHKCWIVTEAKTGQVVFELCKKLPEEILFPLLKILGKLLKPCAKLLAAGKDKPGVKEAAKLIMSLAQPWRDALEALSRAYASV